ncbi:MAG: hypothetical protein IH863_06995 [Chloroflexi bacterium]|nr:hypothetical protein [Chloroflexota bacterium]
MLGIPGANGGSAAWFTNFLHKNAELSFIVIVLIVLVVVFHWVPDEVKIAFLNFFYIPVLAAGFLMGARRAVLSAVLCALVVVIYYLWVWSGGALATSAGILALPSIVFQNKETGLQVLIWAGFLVIVGGSFGHVNERVMNSFVSVQQLHPRIGSDDTGLGQTVIFGPGEAESAWRTARRDHDRSIIPAPALGADIRPVVTRHRACVPCLERHRPIGYILRPGVVKGTGSEPNGPHAAENNDPRDACLLFPQPDRLKSRRRQSRRARVGLATHFRASGPAPPRPVRTTRSRRGPA